MSIMFIRNTAVVIIDFAKSVEEKEVLTFIRASCVESRKVQFLGLQSTPFLKGIIDTLAREGYETALREATRQPCVELVSLGEFAHADVIVINRDAQSLFGALKAVGAVYQQQEGGLAAFEVDALLLHGGSGEEGARMSRSAHLLAEGLASVPSLPPSLADFTDFLINQLFHYFIGCVEQHPAAFVELEQFPRAEGLAAGAKEVASGVWVVDARTTDIANFSRLVTPMKFMPGCKITLVRQKGASADKEGGPKLGLIHFDADMKVVDSQTFPATDLPQEITTILAQFPNLDMSDALFDGLLVPAFQRIFGPPTHV